MATPTLGRGNIYLAPYTAGQPAKDFRYIGNTPEFNLSIESETLEHFNSDEGVNEKDFEVALSTNRTGSLITDAISPENVALFFFGETSNITHTAVTVTDEAIASVKSGRYYQLGATAINPTGVQGLEVHTPGPPAKSVIVTDDATPTPVEYTEGTDFTVDLKSGMLYIVPGGTITDGKNLQVSYKVAAGVFNRVISGAQAVEVALKFITANPAGEDSIYLMPHVTISPNGDYALKGDDWQQIPFNLAILKDAGWEAIYRDGIKYAS